MVRLWVSDDGSSHTYVKAAAEELVVIIVDRSVVAEPPHAGAAGRLQKATVTGNQRYQGHQDTADHGKMVDV